MAREITPIDAFLLVIKGSETRVGPQLIEQLRFFQALFGAKFWDYTIFAISFWSHSGREAYIRNSTRGGLDEATMKAKLNERLRRNFPHMPPLDAVFVDPVYDQTIPEAFADPREKEMYKKETDKLWRFMTNGKQFECDGGCSNPNYLKGTPKLDVPADVQTGKMVVSERISGTLTATWEIWFGDCDQEGVRSYTVLKDDEPIWELVEAPYIATEAWEPGRGRALGNNKPLGLDIVDSCSDVLENGECDNTKSKYKTVTLTFLFTPDHPGKYKIRNMKGESEELEVQQMVDGKPGPWDDWGPCTKTCIGEDGEWGNQKRVRKALPPLHGGQIFKGTLTEYKNCGSHSGDAQLCVTKPKEWGLWGSCSKTCGSGGTRERTRTCSGHGCPPASDMKETKECAASDIQKDWLQKCPEVSKYTQWSAWKCNTKCFNPYSRGGTHQTRTRRCIDDKPVAHSEVNCNTMLLLKEKKEPCSLDPERYVTITGTSCNQGTTCARNGYNYFWCRTGGANSDWDYCSTSRSYTYKGEACTSPCTNSGTNYYWCRTQDSWNECSPRC